MVCVDKYTDVKLLFVNGVTRDDYDALITQEQFEFNQAGYMADVAFKEANPDLMEKLEGDAQAQVTATGC